MLYEITFVLHIEASDSEDARCEARKYLGSKENSGKVVSYSCKDITKPKVRWKIDDAEDQPLAIIEDTEFGDEVCEIGWNPLRNDASPRQWFIAREIVDSHNANLERKDNG